MSSAYKSSHSLVSNGSFECFNWALMAFVLEHEHNMLSESSTSTISAHAAKNVHFKQ